MIKTVYDLTPDELSELKSNYYYNPEIQDFLPDNTFVPDDIPDNIIFSYYEGVIFVANDFFCNC